jgi:hypothetical protein
MTIGGGGTENGRGNGCHVGQGQRQGCAGVFPSHLLQAKADYIISTYHITLSSSTRQQFTGGGRSRDGLP